MHKCSEGAQNIKDALFARELKIDLTPSATNEFSRLIVSAAEENMRQTKHNIKVTLRYGIVVCV